MRRRDDPELRPPALSHNRFDAVLDDAGLDLPRLVDERQPRREPVDRRLREASPPVAVGGRDLLPAGLLIRLPPLGAARLRPCPSRRLHLGRVDQLIADVHHELLLGEPLLLPQPPHRELTQQPRLAALPRQAQQPLEPAELAGVVDLEDAASREPLPPSQLATRALPCLPLELLAERPDRTRVRRRHEPRPRRIARHPA